MIKMHLWYIEDYKEGIIEDLINIIEKCEKKITSLQ